jgi:hypothetical protein
VGVRVPSSALRKTAFPEPEKEAVFEYEEVSLTAKFILLNRRSVTSPGIRVMNINSDN